MPGPGKGLTSKKASFKKLVVLWKVEKRKRQGEERKKANFSDAKEGEGKDESRDRAKLALYRNCAPSLLLEKNYIIINVMMMGSLMWMRISVAAKRLQQALILEQIDQCRLSVTWALRIQ